MPPPLETTNTWCAAVHCYISTKMVSIKQVNDEPASHLSGSGTYSLRFKIRLVPMTHLVFCE